MPEAPADPTTQAPIGVADYASRIGLALREAGPAVVEGEVQRPKQGGRGVWWFDLTDGENVLPCSYLPWLTRSRRPTHEPKHGDRVRVSVRHTEFWGGGGRLRVVVADVETAGEGELLRARAELVERLTLEGLCDPAAFPPLPRFPRGVGLISGKDSDALHDVIRGLRDRFPAVPVLTACCRVQGAAAPREVVDRLARLDADPRVDVIVVARGGGSVQDLACFDDERLCRAIRAISTPVLTAIGHTENNPVCNHVTHAAFVPRHAAERVVPDRRELLREVGHAWAALDRATRRPAELRRSLDATAAGLHDRGRLDGHRAAVGAVGRTVDGHGERFLRGLHAGLGEASRALERGPDRVRAHLAAVGHRIDARAVGPLGRRAVDGLRRDVEAHARLLDAADPRRRGWIAAQDADGRLVRRASDLAPGGTLTLQLADGVADATVTDVRVDAPATDRPTTTEDPA
ncbi:exodeoxyribonuclease VII large subunit [Patulibacter sp.]|uniref:exodeoxyribonuclease VII large subunit n=1 Tax=Patulibacter sp. TaxID=1912859 RepID=UPI002717BBBC|nr:exodeoxyribonuclease VII large subunit [Patulibacter sp.]MDO9409678.1 exodeoxyribonuclease VII large subunit [Patulibacter sp.]